MAHESFEDLEVAEVLNRDFVAIKVDKEERPDVDAVYMSVCQAITGSGGWPLTILMTAEQKPFYAGTYLPKHSRYSTFGLIDLLAAVMKEWRDNREQLLKSGDQIMAAIRTSPSETGDTKVTKESILAASSLFEQNFDKEYGGFGSSPKFPTPHNLLFLLRYHQLEKDAHALEMVEKTLQQMAKGGIFDQIGFGFSRYSTDAKWLVPHFEKMLYDNAMLTIAYLETYQITGNDFYKTVAEKILDYVQREMTDSGGGFYCAQDADSEGEEGKYYAFTPDELVLLLGEEDGTYFNHYFDITDEGNFEGKNIPNRIVTFGIDQPDERIQTLIPKVYAYRLKRTVLHKDDKILTSWNALMIAAFVKAYQILGNELYLAVAQRANRFLLENLTDNTGGLRVRYRDGETSGTGNLDDFAFLIWALLELYDATYDADYLEQAVAFNKKMIANFWDRENDGFYLTAKDAEHLIYRPKETYDGAIPSGNSVAGYCLIKLAKLTADSELEKLAARQLEFLAAVVGTYPAGYSFALMAMMLALYPGREIVCVMKDSDDLEKLKILLRKKYLPNTAVLIINPQNAEKILRIAQFTKDYALQNEKTTFYVCQNNTCSSPINDLSELEKSLS